MTLDDLKADLKSGRAAAIEVHGLDPMIYVIYRNTDEGPQIFRDAKGAPLHFRSRYAALQVLARCGLESVSFVHRSAYGEMIGSEGSSSDTEFREQVHLGPEYLA